MSDALLAAILDAPDDDAPRLVYADALLQRGDPWGEMIVISCELARYGGDGQRWDERGRALVERFHELEKARFPDASIDRTFERGFCTQIQLAGGDLAEVSGPEYALLDSVVVDATPERLDAIAAWPRLASLRKLRLAGDRDRPPIRDRVVRVVAAAHGLDRLELSRTDLTRDDLVALFALPHAAQLRRLAITANASLSGALRDLRWPALEELDLGACGLREVANIEDLLACEALHGLRVFEVSFNSFEDPALAEVIARTPWSRLETLELVGALLGASGFARLFASPHLEQLTTLAIGTTDEDEDIAPALPGLATAFPRLVDLTLRWSAATAGLPAIARPYKKLDFELPNLDPADLAALLGDPALRGLRSLWLSMRRFAGAQPEDATVGERVAAALAAAPLTELASLYLDNCFLGEAGARALAAATQLPRDLDVTCFDEDFGDARAELDARFPYLQVY